ncbi:uncharacterized protein ARMOST_13834 [Armillaria ostoyae]|uniref:Peptidase A2 domain-containing protein n=1 Tax=Armillaria ostoyae TaxID=47428 RepID=A0A284RNY1_ARMOS|nr:uncharacterized protein ARMOST_13834 [Armillaria ostoyae]
MDSKIKEVKDAAENGQIYPISIATSTLKESHNRYAILAISNVSDDEASIETESLTSDLSTLSTDNHSTSSLLRVKVLGKKPPTIVVPIITAALAPRAETTTAGKLITWRAIKDTKNESTAQAVLLNWIHKTRAEEVVDNLLEGLWSSECFCALDWLNELHKPKQYFIRSQTSSPHDLLIPIQLETLESCITVSAKALIDSGCTRSSIHRDFVEKHGIPAGEITAYTKLHLKIGDHSERIDLAITDLGQKEIFLGYDWLIHHNPVINWKIGTITFACCHCVKNQFVLPDANPDDEWELEEGETILAVDFQNTIEICAVHHANDLTAKANKGKEKKTFKQMVPESYHDFKNLFTKESIDELPTHKPWVLDLSLT